MCNEAKFTCLKSKVKYFEMWERIQIANDVTCTFIRGAPPSRGGTGHPPRRPLNLLSKGIQSAMIPRHCVLWLSCLCTWFAPQDTITDVVLVIRHLITLLVFVLSKIESYMLVILNWVLFLNANFSESESYGVVFFKSLIHGGVYFKQCCVYILSSAVCCAYILSIGVRLI